MPLREDVTDRAQSRVGTTLKQKWRLDRIIGVGGMATVYAATHRNQNRVAIKILHPEVVVDAEVTQRFLREGYVANTVRHPGTVQVLDDDLSDDGAAFLVMELLEGETLEARWERKNESLPVDEVLAIADQLLDVLAVAHDAGVVHRDMKPENLFLTTDGRLKVLDFGIARLREVSAAGQTTTRAGSLLGTPAFMAPEQARGRWDSVDNRTDIWGIGATLFTLLTGRFVHEAGTLNEQLIFAATTPPASIATVEPELPRCVVELIDRALAFDKEERFPDAQTMQAAVRRAFETLAFEGPPSLPRTSVARHADPDTATLIAPPEVTSAITGRASTVATDRVMLRTAHSDGRSAGKSRLVLMSLGALAVLGVAGTLAVLALHDPPAATSGGAPAAEPPALVQAPHTAESRPVASAPAPAKTASAAPAKTAPTSSGASAAPARVQHPATTPHTVAQPTAAAAPAATTGHAPAATTGHAPAAPTGHKSIHPPAVQHPNPFDRRH